MAYRIVSVLALTVALAASQAHAQTSAAPQNSDETVVTTPSAAAAPPPAVTTPATTSSAAAPSTPTKTPMTTDQQVKAWVADAPQLDHAPQAEANADGTTSASGNGTDAAAALRQIHGSAGGSVGSNGYSSEYVSTLIPIGKDGTLGVAVGQSNYGGNTVDHGRYRIPKTQTQSLAISLQLGNGGGDDPTDCVPGFWDGGRYIEPVWVTRLHPELACTAEELDQHAEKDTTGQ